MQLLINHLGYECFGPKQAILQSEKTLSHTHAELVRYHDQQTVMQLPLHAHASIDNWHTGTAYSICFTQWQLNGRYILRVGDVTSAPFDIANQLLFKRTYSDVLHYFKSQRCGGIYEQQDRRVPLHGSDEKVDVHGGWYDASGDVSKYLSHLSYGNYLNPQQTPMVVWNMLQAHELIQEHPDTPEFLLTRTLEEALHGADFLYRMQSPAGFFYLTVFDNWSKDPKRRQICAYQGQDGICSDSYQAGYRQGGGVAIAALAAASRHLKSTTSTVALSAYSAEDYLFAAEKGFAHLEKHNCDYLDDGTENIIDDYCALLACVELYQATLKTDYLQAARLRADSLMQRQCSDDNYSNFWSANSDGSRPYFHAAEAGLPVISLCQLLKIETNEQRRDQLTLAINQAIHFELSITHEVSNPFGYPRQYTKSVDQAPTGSFFVAQNNETGYWWQGENARLGSLAAMMYTALPHCKSSFHLPMLQYAQHALDWILGLNPFDMCMLDGHGHNNPDYLPDIGFQNAKGGICNGITAGFDDPLDIAFNPYPHADDMLQNWRWGEQWIPHAGWYLLAVCLQFTSKQQENHYDE